MANAPSTTAVVRQKLIQETRPDLLRPIHVQLGVIAGRNLKICDKNSSDPYFQCKFYDGTKKKTKTIKKNLEPQWNEPGLYVPSFPHMHTLSLFH